MKYRSECYILERMEQNLKKSKFLLPNLLSSCIFKTVVHASFACSRFSGTICCGGSSGKGFSTYRPCTKWVRNKIWWEIILACGEKDFLAWSWLFLLFEKRCIYIHNLDLSLQFQTHISNYLPDFTRSSMLLI